MILYAQLPINMKSTEPVLAFESPEFSRFCPRKYTSPSGPGNKCISIKQSWDHSSSRLNKFYRLPSLICSYTQKHVYIYRFNKPFVRSLLPKSWTTLSHAHKSPIFSISWPYCNMWCIEDTADALRNALLEYEATASKLQPKTNLDRLLTEKVGIWCFC